MKIVGHLKVIGFGLIMVVVGAWTIAQSTTPVQADAAAGTVITVTTTEDLATSSNFSKHTCNFTSGAFFFPATDGKCTLRRAIVEAGARPDVDRPISIEFNIPIADSNYDATLKVWEVQIDASHKWELKRRLATYHFRDHRRPPRAEAPGLTNNGP